MMKWFPYTFQNFFSSEGVVIDWLHDYTLFFNFRRFFVSGGLFSLSQSRFLESKTVDISSLEFLWTLVPSGVLVLIGLPSLSALYSSEGKGGQDTTVKVVGHQWYWSYDYCDFSGVDFDAFMVPLSNLKSGESRLLETDNHVVLPLGGSSRMVVSSSDVLHSWALPSLGVKADANPGRMNILVLPSFEVPGVFYGQCSEICGANHSFMPIVVEVSSFFGFLGWAQQF